MNGRAALFLAGLTCLLQASAQEARKPEPKDTEVWTPEPRRVVPGTVGTFPSDAVVLFGGADLGEWVSSNSPGQPAGWTVADGVLTVRGGSGDIHTRRLFLDYQLHLEWRVPPGLPGSGQGRGNSGIFLASTGPGAGYEIQVLDCDNNKTYANGQAASVYKQHIPLANTCAPAGAWQTYDIVWTAPRFGHDGTLLSPATVTVFHNGVLVQNHVTLQGETVYVGQPAYRRHGHRPIRLQDHGDPVSYRNIWVRPL